MSSDAVKTPATRAVESLLGNLAGGLISAAAADNPSPPLAEEDQTVSPSSIVFQIGKHLAEGDHLPAARLALILASWLARGEGLNFTEASKLAALSWTQTSGLPRPPRLR